MVYGLGEASIIPFCGFVNPYANLGGIPFCAYLAIGNWYNKKERKKSFWRMFDFKIIKGENVKI